MNIKQISLAFILVFIISFLVIYPAFHIGLYGDDWLAIFRYVVHVLPFSKDGLIYFSYFLTPYGSQDIIMGLLYQKFGTNAFYYEVTAYIFRLLAAFSLYPLVLYLTKSKLATFFAILFFAITTIGFDSTGWLLTMSTYLTVAFFNIFLYFYILFHDKNEQVLSFGNKFKFLFISGVFFYLAYITASARMIGAPMFILSLEAFWLIKNRTIHSLKSSSLRLIILIFILFIISTTGHTLGNRSDWFERLISGITTMQKLLTEGRSDFLLYPIVTIGGMIIPNFTLPDIQINTKKDMLKSVAMPALILFSFILLMLKSNTSKIRRYDIYKSLAAASAWIVIVFFVRKFNIISFSSSALIMLLVTGGLLIIICAELALKYHSQSKILIAIVISFFWTLLSFFPAWIWSPGSYFESTHRYLTSSAIGISLLLATIISLGKTSKNQLYLGLLLSPLLLLHMTSTQIYINKLLNSHSQQIVDKIWSSIPHISDVGKKPVILYFEGDESNGGILGDSVMFGFPFHIALLYNLKESDTFPRATTNWDEAVSTVKDEKLKFDQVYGFRLEDKDNLVNITNEIRNKLAEEK